MSKVSKMSMKSILESIDALLLREYDIVYFCDNMDVIKEFINKYSGKVNKGKELKEFLINNEQYFDKEKFILLLVKNHKDNIETIKTKIEELSKIVSIETGEEVFQDLFKLRLQAMAQKENLEKVMRLGIGKGMETTLSFYYFDEKEQRYRIDVVDSKEVIDNKRVSNYKNLKWFDNIDSYFKGKSSEQDLGMEFILQSILLTDLYRVFPSEQLGSNIRTMILENYILKTKSKTRQEIEALKTYKTYDEYTELIDNTGFTEMIPDIKNTLREYVQYIDIDKLLLISAYRFYEALENGTLDPKVRLSVKEILIGILANIKERNAKISCQLQSKFDGLYTLEEVEFSTEDIKKCINQFTKTDYMTTQEIEEYRNKVSNQDISLSEIAPECIKIIFSQEELEEMSILSQENLIYVSQVNEWDTEQILNSIIKNETCNIETLRDFIEEEKLGSNDLIKLYDLGIISAQDVKEFRDTIDFSDDINFEKLNEYYKATKTDIEEETLNKYNKYLNLYKTVLITGKSEEDIQEVFDTTIEGIVDNFDEKDYKIAIKDYYQAGLITLDSIIEWGSNDDISYLYDNEVISLKDVEGLVEREILPISYIREIYDQLIWENNLSEEERVSILIKGWISKDIIQALYMKTLISNKDLERLVAERIITEEEKENIVDGFDLESAEKSSESSDYLEIDDSMKKINNNIYAREKGWGRPDPNYLPKKDKIVIDPAIRETFFEALGARKVRAKISENSPFYNYDFYMILGKDGKKHMNTPVIAERYFADKDTEDEFATDNATYFFQYGDFLVLRNYIKKDEVVNKKENVVFRSSHTVSKSGRKGKWASSVIGNVIRTILSSDLKEYNKDNQKLIILQKIKELYIPEEIRKILTLEEEIDSGNHLYRVIKELRIEGDGKLDISDEDGER